MAITRWDPFRNVVALRNEMDRLFGDTFGRRPRLPFGDGLQVLPVDIEAAKPRQIPVTVDPVV